MRLAVYTDHAYHKEGGRFYAERAFILFVAELARHFERTLVVGRLHPVPGRAAYALPEHLGFVPLRWYPRLTAPARAAWSIVVSLRQVWRAAGTADVLWIIGPHPLAILLVLAARLRGRRVVLGIRQDTVAYVSSRHPEHRWFVRAARALERCWLLLSRRLPIVVVGPAIAKRYARARRLLPIVVSLVREADIVAPAPSAQRSDDDETVVLSVGRLEAEKNPLLLADVLKELRADGRPWRLRVCGEGPLQGALERRLDEDGTREAADLLGYVPAYDGLLRLYRSGHLFLHVSWTEGFPQVIPEAFAAGLPVVATAVGGVSDAVGDCALLVPPGDARAAATALRRIAAEPALRAQLIDRGLRHAAAHTLEQEAARVASFLRDDRDSPAP